MVVARFGELTRRLQLTQQRLDHVVGEPRVLERRILTIGCPLLAKLLLERPPRGSFDLLTPGGQLHLEPVDLLG